MWEVGGRDEGGPPRRIYSCISFEDLIARGAHVRLQNNQAHPDCRCRRTSSARTLLCSSFSQPGRVFSHRLRPTVCPTPQSTNVPANGVV